MATTRTRKGEAALNLDSTMREDAVLESGEESDVMDNIVFRRPVTRGSSKTAASPAASSSTQPARRRSTRLSSSMSPLKRPSHSRRASQSTSTPSSSPPQPSQSQSQSQSQSDPPANDEPTGMSQEMAGVSVSMDLQPEQTDAPMDNAEPHSRDPVPAPALVDTYAPPNKDMLPASDPSSATLDARSNSAPGSSKAHTVVFETEPVLGSQPQSVPAKREPKSSTRTPLALPIFSVTSSPGGTEEEPSLVVPAPENLTIDSDLSIGNVSSDVLIPASLAPPVRAHTPRRSPRLSGSAPVDISSSSPPHTMQSSAATSNISTTSTGFIPPRQTKKLRAKALVREPVAGPSTTANDASSTIVAANKGKEKEHVSSPPTIPDLTTATKTNIFNPSQVRSLSPESDAVLMSLHQTLNSQPRPKLISKSAERPPPPPSAMKRQAEDSDPSSPGKRARFDPDPQPPPTPPPPIPKPNLTRPARIRVHPSSSIQNGSFLGGHPPIVVRPSGSPSRQQLLLQRPAGPPMRVPVGQQQRVAFPQRVASPIRTGSHHGVTTKNPSPVKLQRSGVTLVWQRAAPISAPAPVIPNRAQQSASQIKPEVLIAPRDNTRSPPLGGSTTPDRTARSRLPVLKATSGVPRATGEKEKEKSKGRAGEDGDVHDNESGLPPAGAIGTSAEASTSTSAGTLQVPPLAAPREPTPPTPLETPASPGSSSSTLIMDVPLFYQPPAPRLPPIQQRTAEEIIAQGVEREAQRKRERQGQVKSAVDAAAALRCVPLSRAGRIIPNGSALNPWLSMTETLNESQKELQKLTRENTEKNTAYACKLELTESFRNTPRPASPTSRIRTIAQKAKETERQERAERAQRRSASRGDTSATTSATPEPPSGHMFAPGDEEQFESPVRAGRHVRWSRALVHDDVGPGASEGPSSVAETMGRGCLAKTYELDRHGNARDAGATIDGGGSVKVVRYVYKDERRKRSS